MAAGVLFGALLVLSMVFVWLSIQRTERAYSLNRAVSSLEEARKLKSKLEVERDNLLSPDRLRAVGKSQGLVPAAPGQIRRLDK